MEKRNIQLTCRMLRLQLSVRGNSLFHVPYLTTCCMLRSTTFLDSSNINHGSSSEGVTVPRHWPCLLARGASHPVTV